jgi:hypothetical protein
MRPRPIVKKQRFYKPLQKEERGSLGLILRGFELFLIVVKVLCLSWCKGHNKSRT